MIQDNHVRDTRRGLYGPFLTYLYSHYEVYPNTHSVFQSNIFLFFFFFFFLFFLLPLLYIAFSSAETICQPAPSGQVPTLSSCDATLLKLETYISTCGSEKVTVGPTAGGIRLPLYYVDDDLSPFVPRSRCMIQVLWHPRSGQRPPVASFDIFRPQEIQQAAIRVRDQCVKGNQFHGPQLGKEWILTRQWVLVLFGTAFVGRGGG